MRFVLFLLRCRRIGLGFLALSCGFGALLTAPAQAEACGASANLEPCFDANSLWLPAGRAAFMTLPDTRVNAPGKLSLGFATEFLHAPVTFQVSSPDRSGRTVFVVGDALDSSLFFAAGVPDHLEVTATLPARLYQHGAGADAAASQSAPAIQQAAVRDPRLGVAYSLDDALNRPGYGLRLGVELSLPLGDESAAAGERSVVAVPSVTFGWQHSRVAIRASAGARLRRSVDFGDTRLGSEASIALGIGVDVFDPGLLFLSLEGFALPPLGSSRASTANEAITSVTWLPVEWFFAARTSFRRGSEWSLAGSFGTGLPLSSETRSTSTGADSSHFLAVTEPEWRSVLYVRFTPK